MKFPRLGLALALTIPTSCGGKTDTSHQTTDGGAGGSAGRPSVVCMHNGVPMQVGDSYDNEGECLLCECTASGDIVCGEGIDCFQGCGDAYGTYRLGVTFPDPRSCGTCTCEMDGVVRCSPLPCPASCDFAGHTYANGEKFVNPDGCSPCNCADGSATCATAICPCDPQREPNRSYFSLDASSCPTTSFVCQSSMMPFINACGCGCEQSPSCPPYSDCSTAATTGDGATSAGGAPNSAATGSTGAAGTQALAPCPMPEERAACPLSWPA